MSPQGRRAAGMLVVLGAALLVSVVLLVSCQPGWQRGPAVLDAILYPNPPLIRVALVVGSATAADPVLGGEGRYQVLEAQTGEVLWEGTGLAASGVSVAGSGLRLGGRSLSTEGFRVRSLSGSPLRVNGTAYPGDLLFFRDGDAVTVVNEVEVESYLAGVLGAEMPLKFEDEALRAQVVAARTYVLYEAKTARSPFYDLLATEASQVYRGLAVATRRARRLVRSTRGVILTTEGRTFPAFYHSTCGGHTVDAAEVWPGLRLGVLRGVPCGYCSGSPYYRWTVEFGAQEVSQALERRGLFSGPVTAIAVTRRAASGYATDVEVRGPGGRRQFRARALRSALGSRRLKSTYFTVLRIPDGFRFRGRGYGHGVGLCQWGAQGMAQAGHDYQEILAHYYPGSELVRIYP